MSMQVVHFTDAEGGSAWGVVDGDQVVRLAEPFAGHRALLTHGAAALAAAAAGQGERLPLAGLGLLSPITRPTRLLCLGLNYAEHREETGQPAAKPAEMLFFPKAEDALAPPSGDIVRPAGVALLDYEIELALVLRRPIARGAVVTDETLGDHVAGIVLCNDVSARDDQFCSPFMQWVASKSHPGFCPTGPVLHLLAADAIGVIDNLDLECRLNGAVVQSINTRHFIFRPSEALTRLARFYSLEVGDCILTGTPGGVQMQIGAETRRILTEHFFDDAARRAAFVVDQLGRSRYLQHGDLLELSIRSPDGRVNLGTQRSRIVEGG